MSIKFSQRRKWSVRTFNRMPWGSKTKILLILLFIKLFKRRRHSPRNWRFSCRLRHFRRRLRRRCWQCSWLLGERDTITTACTWRGRRREEGKRERCRQLLRGHWGARSAPSRGASECFCEASAQPAAEPRRRSGRAAPATLQPAACCVCLAVSLNCALSIDHNYPPQPTHTLKSFRQTWLADRS